MKKLFAILIALAVLLAPAFTRAGQAFAAVPDHHMQMMESGRCSMPAGDTADHDKAPAKNCCMSMCMAVAIAPPVPPAHEEVRRAPAEPGVRTFHVGLPAEIATPPPRSA
jgi:hypothetical protein